jgi:hypothetical protein
MAAEASYRRAASTTDDDPDLHIRHALALTWLGRSDEAAAACLRAVSLDGRLADRPAERLPDELPPVVARGQRILADLAIAGQADDAEASAAVAAFQARWIGRAEAPLAALAARGSADR